MKAFWLALVALCSVCGQTLPSRELSLTAGRGELLQFGRDVTKVVVSEPRIADAIVVSPTEVMVNGKSPGQTTLIVWETGSTPVRYEIGVVADASDLDSLRRVLREALPEATLDVKGSAETIVLSGSVKDADQSKRAAAIASTRTKNVVNLLHVAATGDPRQILLQVKFASVDRVALQELGFNYFSTNDKMMGALTTQQFQMPRFSQLQFE